MPLGLTLDPATGRIFGTLARARPRPYAFRVHVFDKSVANPSPLRLLLSLQVMRGPRPGKAPTLEPISPPVGAFHFAGVDNGAAAATNGDAGRAAQSGVGVEVLAFEPKARTTLALKIKASSVRQLEVLVKGEGG